MRTYAKNRRRTPLRVEALEGKTLLSAGSAMRHVVPQVTAAPMVDPAAAFSGTLTGHYSNVNIPGFSHMLNYATSGTLGGVGSTRLRGSLIPRGGIRAGRLAGEFRLRNSGGTMVVNVSQSATPGDYTYSVVRARGSDAAFNGGSGTLVIRQASSFSVPFFISGQATTTFNPG